LAGSKGLDRRIQAVTLFDAPDGYKWFKGKEFVVTTGYLFKNDYGLFKNVILHLHQNNAAGLGIKVDRFLKAIPEEIINMCNEFNLPLISLPYEAAWIDVINAVNAVVLNRYILRINDTKKLLPIYANYQYFDKKIRGIIQNLSIELGKSVLIYDLMSDNVYSTGKQISSKKNSIDYTDLWDPSFSHQREIICDKLKIYRIKNIEDKKKKSWITIPIIVQNITVAYFVVWETGNKIDYYDLFSIRLSYTLLSYVYEQIYLMNSMEGIFQDEFIQDIIKKTYKDEEKLYKRAQNLQINIDKKFICICIQQLNENIYLYEHREKISRRIYQSFSRKKAIFGLQSKNQLVILYETYKDIVDNGEIKDKCSMLIDYLEKDIPYSDFKCGIGYTVDRVFNIRKSYIESIKSIEIGGHIYPSEKVVLYKELGPFGLFRIEAFQQEDFNTIVEDISPIFSQDDKDELLLTLKAYLDSGCNYNLAAKKLFIHSNTVRYRIDKIQQLCYVDFKNPIERLKLEIILKFINLLNT